ncbi:MAG TPA: hypothetical protein PLP21_04165 [Pyrinomonadaceae bacterium]|nr:hypothetical protein [Acidobacteriota bacterium]HQZ95486.1 hypothetical protein [Pyrinomonadaceae bacterium]
MLLIKKIVYPLFLTGLVVISASAQSAAFNFKPQRVAVGTVFHYLKTNTDGTKSENVSLYVATNARIESFKFHEKGTQAGLVVAEMDWAGFFPKKIESYQVFSKEDRRLFATLTFQPSSREVDVLIPAFKPDKESAKIARLPFHLYNFDLASLNVSFPHLRDPKKSFVVGIADPTFKPDGPMFAYRGDLNIRYQRDETRNGEKCRLYEASGPGIGGKGLIWVNTKGSYIEDMEFDVANNPDWKTFKLKLLKTEKLTPDGWQQFIASHF